MNHKKLLTTILCFALFMTTIGFQNVAFAEELTDVSEETTVDEDSSICETEEIVEAEENVDVLNTVDETLIDEKTNDLENQLIEAENSIENGYICNDNVCEDYVIDEDVIESYEESDICYSSKNANIDSAELTKLNGVLASNGNEIFDIVVEDAYAGIKKNGDELVYSFLVANPNNSFSQSYFLYVDTYNGGDAYCDFYYLVEYNGKYAIFKTAVDITILNEYSTPTFSLVKNDIYGISTSKLNELANNASAHAMTPLKGWRLYLSRYYGIDFTKLGFSSMESLVNALPKKTIATSGIYCASNYPSIQAGINIQKSSESDTVEYRWVACNNNEPDKWFEISPWTKNNNWMNWTPDKSGGYVFVCYARVVGNENASQIQATFGTEYHKDIKGICQMPYTGEGGGYLIGIESYDNPNHSYKYEMLILDCNLYVQGLDAWVYDTGKCGAQGNCLWTIWQPQYGYYWTLFRIYDENDNLIDEACYGFANIF